MTIGRSVGTQMHVMWMRAQHALTSWKRLLDTINTAANQRSES